MLRRGTGKRPGTVPAGLLATPVQGWIVKSSAFEADRPSGELGVTPNPDAQFMAQVARKPDQPERRLPAQVAVPRPQFAGSAKHDSQRRCFAVADGELGAGHGTVLAHVEPVGAGREPEHG